MPYKKQQKLGDLVPRKRKSTWKPTQATYYYAVYVEKPIAEYLESQKKIFGAKYSETIRNALADKIARQDEK